MDDDQIALLCLFLAVVGLIAWLAISIKNCDTSADEHSNMFDIIDRMID